VLRWTNIPWVLDVVIWRRFELCIYITLPEEHAQLEILKQNVGNIYHVLTEANLKTLAAKTEGYFNGTKIIN